MNANELATKLSNVGWDKPFASWEMLDEAATMLRQQQTKIEALKKEAALQRLSDFTQEVDNEPVALKVSKGEICYLSNEDDQSYGMWCPINYDTNHGFPEGTKFYTHPAKTLTDEEIESWITEWAKDLYGTLYVEPTDHQRTMAIKMARAILKKASEK